MRYQKAIALGMIGAGIGMIENNRFERNCSSPPTKNILKSIMDGECGLTLYKNSGSIKEQISNTVIGATRGFALGFTTGLNIYPEN